MDQTAAVVLDHHEHVEQPERGSHDDQEVTGDDSVGMQTQECRPAQVSPWSARRAMGQILPYGSRRHLNLQLQQKLVRDAFLAPGRVLTRHPADQSLQLLGNRRSAGSRLQAPEQSPSRTVPTAVSYTHLTLPTIYSV